MPEEIFTIHYNYDRRLSFSHKYHVRSIYELNLYKNINVHDLRYINPPENLLKCNISLSLLMTLLHLFM